jgi:dTDP-4-amino-4,6-dideoxygalactose transaminase
MNPPDDYIPMLDLTSEIDELWDDVSSAVLGVVRSGSFVLGPEVERFESEVAAFLGVRHAVGLNSGTDALVIGLRALGVEPGDEVITTSFSFFATAEAIVTVGAEPVFVDVEEDTFNIDANLIEAAVTKRTKAIIPVHLFGLPAGMDEVMAVAGRHGLIVLEDCAQSFGANYRGRRTGTLGRAGAFSFYPTKNLGAYGDGGMLATNDDDVAELARILRNHGASPERRYENRMIGYNSRLDEIQAAVLRVKLPYVERWNEERRRVAQAYRQRLGSLPSVRLPTDDAEHVCHQFTIRVSVETREDLVKSLKGAGIATSVFYPVPLHRLSGVERSLPVSEKLAGEVLSLPMWPKMDEDKIDRVCSAITAMLAEKGRIGARGNSRR